jgi:hypothetical protein
VTRTISGIRLRMVSEMLEAGTQRTLLGNTRNTTSSPLSATSLWNCWIEECAMLSFFLPCVKVQESAPLL